MLKDPKKKLNMISAAIDAAVAVKRMTGEEGYKFFLNLLNLQPVPAVSKPAKPVVVAQPAERAPASAVPAPASLKPGTILSAPAQTASHPTTAPARVPQGPLPRREVRKQTPPTPVAGDFAFKLNMAAMELGHEDKSPLAQFRKLLGDMSGRGREYWDECRKWTAEVLSEGSLTEADWKLLVGVMKRNLFFTDRKGADAFLATCDKDHLKELLLGEGGLWQQVEMIRQEVKFNQTSPYQLRFIMEACVVVGKEAKELLENCKHAVNRMKQKRFIRPEHWLVAKVSEISHPHIPAEKYAPPEELQASADDVPAPEQEPEQVPQAAEEAVPVELALVAVVEEPTNGRGKPETLGTDFGRVFEQQMLVGVGETESVGIPPAPAIEVGEPEGELVPV